jgi:hypothetical protein
MQGGKSFIVGVFWAPIIFEIKQPQRAKIIEIVKTSTPIKTPRTPPRPWGRRQVWWMSEPKMRFTPTPVGTTLEDCLSLLTDQ